MINKTFPQTYVCDGTITTQTELWTTQCTFPVYVIALTTILGWLFFMARPPGRQARPATGRPAARFVRSRHPSGAPSAPSSEAPPRPRPLPSQVFAGVGFIALPADLLKAWQNRPRETITKSEFIKQATEMGKRAKLIMEGLQAVHNDEKRNGKTRKTRGKVKELTAELLALEEEEYHLREQYPQGDDPGLSWAMTILGYYFSLVFGVASVALTGCWLIHLVVYCFVSPPLSPMLNQMFIDLDSVFGLFGTLFFAIFCFYLVCCTVKGNTKLGLNLLIFTARAPGAGGASLFASRVPPSRPLPGERKHPPLRPGPSNSPRSENPSPTRAGVPDAARQHPHELVPLQHRPHHALLHLCHPVLLPGAPRPAFAASPLPPPPPRARPCLTRSPLLLPSHPISNIEQVFDQYAMETAVDQIFGNQVFNLRGIGYLFRTGAFLYCLFIIAGLTALVRAHERLGDCSSSAQNRSRRAGKCAPLAHNRAPAHGRRRRRSSRCRSTSRRRTSMTTCASRGRGTCLIAYTIPHDLHVWAPSRAHGFFSAALAARRMTKRRRSPLAGARFVLLRTSSCEPSAPLRWLTAAFHVHVSCGPGRHAAAAAE